MSDALLDAYRHRDEIRAMLDGLRQELAEARAEVERLKVLRDDMGRSWAQAEAELAALRDKIGTLADALPRFPGVPLQWLRDKIQAHFVGTPTHDKLPECPSPASPKS